MISGDELVSLKDSDALVGFSHWMEKMLNPVSPNDQFKEPHPRKPLVDLIFRSGALNCTPSLAIKLLKKPHQNTTGKEANDILDWCSAAPQIAEVVPCLQVSFAAILCLMYGNTRRRNNMNLLYPSSFAVMKL